MSFEDEEIDAVFAAETRLPSTARLVRSASWMTDVTAGLNGDNVGIIGPINPAEE